MNWKGVEGTAISDLVLCNKNCIIFILFIGSIFVYHMPQVNFWQSENNFEELVLSFHLYVDPGNIPRDAFNYMYSIYLSFS